MHNMLCFMPQLQTGMYGKKTLTFTCLKQFIQRSMTAAWNKRAVPSSILVAAASNTTYTHIHTVSIRQQSIIIILDHTSNSSSMLQMVPAVMRRSLRMFIKCQEEKRGLLSSQVRGRLSLWWQNWPMAFPRRQARRRVKPVRNRDTIQRLSTIKFKTSNEILTIS